MKTIAPSLLLLSMALTVTAAEPVAPGWLGLGYAWSTDGRSPKVLHVQRLAEGGPAAAAGVRVTDIITSMNGRRVDFGDELDLLLYLGDRKPGEYLRLGILRDSKVREIRVRLGTMPETSRVAWKSNLEVAKRKRLESRPAQ